MGNGATPALPILGSADNPDVQIVQGPPAPKLSGKTTPLFSPAGELADIPIENVNAAIASGGQVAVPMVSPDGQRTYIPHNRLQDALKAGGKFDSSTADAAQELVNAHSITGIGSGIAKGAIDTARSVLGIVGGPGAVEKIAPQLANINTSAQTGYESTGKAAEGMLEFMAGDDTLKGLSLADKFDTASKIAKLAETSPRVARALEIGMNALRVGSVGTAQGLAKGETPGQALITGAVAGVTGGALETAAAGGQSLREALLGGKTPEELAEEFSNKIEGLTGKLGATGTQSEIASDVQGQLENAKAQMHNEYEAGLDRIGQRANAIQLKIGLQGSPIQKAAQQLLSDPRVPQEFIGSPSPEIERLAPQLESFANPKASYSWDQLEATRKMIGQQLRAAPYGSPLRPYLGALRDGLDDTLSKAAETSSDPTLAKDMADLRSNYADKINRFNTTAIRRLVDTNPDSVASILLGKSSIDNIQNLRSLVGAKNMGAVEGSLLRDIAQKSTGSDGQLNLQRVVGAWEKMGPDVKQAFWGKNTKQIQSVMDEIQGELDKAKGSKTVTQHLVRRLGDVARASSWIGLYGLLRGNTKEAKDAAMALAIVSTLMNPSAVGAATNALRGAAAVLPAATAQTAISAQGQEQPQNEPENIFFQSSDGATHSIPNTPDALKQAKQIDPDLHILAPENKAE
jgi:hypothetical protein